MKENMEFLKEIIPFISEAKNYWFIRTQSGSYYDYFKEVKKIAIGPDKINKTDLEQALAIEKTGTGNAKEYLKDKIIKKYDGNIGRPGLLAANLLVFIRDIKKGDFVIIPSYAAYTILIGIVQDNYIYEEFVHSKTDAFECPYKIRRKVEWLNSYPLTVFHPQMINLKFAQNTVLNINHFKSYINQIYFPIYIEKDKLHINLNVGTHEKVNGKDLYGFNYELLELVDEIYDEISTDNIDKNSIEQEIETKINVQSPGIIEFIGDVNFDQKIFYLLLILLISFGMEIEILKLKIKFPGLFPSIYKLNKDRHKAELWKTISERAKKLNLNPKELIALLKALNKKDNEKDEEEKK